MQNAGIALGEFAIKQHFEITIYRRGQPCNGAAKRESR